MSSSTATIELQAVRLLIERRTRAAIAYPLLYLCGRAATPPIRTAREASAKLPGETSANVCGAESTMRVQLRAVSNQLPRMNRWRRIRSRRRPRAPGTSFAFAPPCSPRPYGSAKTKP